MQADQWKTADMGKSWKNLTEKFKMVKALTLKTNFKKEYLTFAVTSSCTT